MKGLFNIVEKVRRYGKEEVRANELTISDCLYLYEHGVEMKVDARRQICILEPQSHFKKDKIQDEINRYYLN